MKHPALSLKLGAPGLCLAERELECRVRPGVRELSVEEESDFSTGRTGRLAQFDIHELMKLP